MTLLAVNLLQFALIAVAGLGFALTVTQPRLRALAALLAMSSSWMVFNFLEETSGFRDIWLVTPAYRLAYPALVYLVMRGVMMAGPALRWRDWPHAVPFLAALALTPQIGLVEHAARISLVAYSGAALWLLYRFQQATRETRSDARNLQLNWMLGLLAFYIVDGVFDVARMDAHWLHTEWPWLATESAYVFQISISLVFVCVLVVLAVRQTRLFSGLESGALMRDEDEGAVDDAASAALVDAFGRVEACVRGEALYTEPRLTRQEVAQAARLPGKTVSAAIKAATGRNFNDYVNALRIEDVQAMMRADVETGERRRLIDLAYTAGFSSKSVFNAVFKRETGLTPSAFVGTLDNAADRPASGPAPV